MKLPVAVLIDGENMSYLLIGRILAEAELCGIVTVRHVYMKSPSRWVIRRGHLQPRGAWYDAAACYDFEVRTEVPAQAGKNAIDIALTVGAMDLFYSGIRQFCLATSDHDFIALVSRLKEAGCMVLGICNINTSIVLREAYTRFVETSDLAPPVPWTSLWEVVEVIDHRKSWNERTVRKRRKEGTHEIFFLTSVDWELLEGEETSLQDTQEEDMGQSGSFSST